MKQRGRQSVAAQNQIITNIDSAVLDRVPRQPAPHDLTDEETEVWASVVNSEAADWFTPSSAPLLTQYCRHVIQSRRIAELIEKATSDPALDVKDYQRLLDMQRGESAALGTLAQKMRISPHSQTNHRGNKKPSSRKPWEG